MSERAPRPTRDDYVVWRRATTRWADDDAYGHMNNATYYELFDTAVNASIKPMIVPSRPINVAMFANVAR